MINNIAIKILSYHHYIKHIVTTLFFGFSLVSNAHKKHGSHLSKND